MIALGILFIVFGLILFIGSSLCFYDRNFILGVLAFIFGVVACTIGMNWIVYEFKSHEQKIECSEIKQIDTLYKNDSIIGYEIIYMEQL